MEKKVMLGITILVIIQIIALGLVAILFFYSESIKIGVKTEYLENPYYCEEDSDCKDVYTCGCSCISGCVNIHNWEPSNCESICSFYCPLYLRQYECGCEQNECKAVQVEERLCTDLCIRNEKDDRLNLDDEVVFNWKQFNCSMIVNCSCEFNKPMKIKANMSSEIILDKACDIWRLAHNCRDNMFNTSIISFWDAGDDEETPYSVNMLCEKTGFTKIDCYKECNCPY